MKWEVKTELVVQEKQAAPKKELIVKYSTMDVVADDFDTACTAAKELCLEGENITSCAVILEE